MSLLIRRRRIFAIPAIVACLVCFGAKAATTTYQDGDVFVGFRATSGTGVTKDYLVNLGPASQFTSVPSGTTITLSLGNLGADLSATFGPTWFSRSDLLWGIIGTQVIGNSADPDNTIYVSNSDVVPWDRDFGSSQSFTDGLIDLMRFTYQGLPSTANSPVGLIQNVADDNSYASFQPGGVNSGDVSFQTY